MSFSMEFFHFKKKRKSHKNAHDVLPGIDCWIFFSFNKLDGIKDYNVDTLKEKDIGTIIESNNNPEGVLDVEIMLKIFPIKDVAYLFENKNYQED